MEPEQLMQEMDEDLRKALALLTRFEPAVEDVTVADESGKVEVTFHPDLSLAKVSVAADWQSEIEPGMLEAAVSETMARGLSKAMGFDLDDVEAIVDDEPDPNSPEVKEAAARTMRDAEDILLAPRSESEVQHMVDNIDNLFAEFDAVADKAMTKLDNMPMPKSDEEFQEEGQDPAGELVESDNHMVAVRVARGIVGGCTIRESWLDGRSGIAVTESFSQIIERLPDVVAAQTSTGA